MPIATAPLVDDPRFAGLLTHGPNGPTLSKPHAACAQRLDKLKGTLAAAPAATGLPSYYSRARAETWSRLDPLGQFGLPAGVAWNVSKMLTIDTDDMTFGDSDTLRIERTNENFDVEVAGVRRLLTPFAYDHGTQHYYCVDLGQPADAEIIDVYEIDHDGTGAKRYGTLEKFLKTLKPVAKKKPAKQKGGLIASELRVTTRAAAVGSSMRENIEVSRLRGDLTVVTAHARLYLMDNGVLGPPVMYPMREGMTVDHPAGPRWLSRDVLASGPRLIAVRCDQITFVDIATRSVEPPALTAPDGVEWQPIVMDEDGLLLMGGRHAAVARIGLDGSVDLVDERASEGEVHALGDRVVMLRSEGNQALATIFDAKLVPHRLAPITAESTDDDDDERWRPGRAAVRDGETPVVVMPGTGEELAVWRGDEAKRIALPFRAWEVALGDRAIFGHALDCEVVRLDLDGTVRWRCKPPSTWSTRRTRLLVCGAWVVSVANDAVHLIDIETGTIAHTPKIPLVTGEVIDTEGVFELGDSFVVIPERHAKVATKAYRVLADGSVQTLEHKGVKGACRGDSSCAFMTWSTSERGSVETVIKRWT